MSHAISPTPVNPSGVTVSVPDPGDNRTAASVVTPFTSIWSGVLGLFGILTGTVAQNVSFNGTLNTTGKIISADGVESSSSASGIRSGTDLVADLDLSVGRSAQIAGALTVGSVDIKPGGYLDASASANVYLPDTTAYGPVRFGGGGRVVNKMSTNHAATVGMSVNVAGGSRYYFTTAAVGSTITIDDTGAEDGDEFWFTNNATTQIAVYNTGGSLLANIRSANVSMPRTLQAVRMGGVWGSVARIPSL